jgi:dTMP kinase
MKCQALRGKFIVLDGPDGAGKSTQIALLQECLQRQALEVEVVRDPGGTDIGDQIRAILLDPANVAMSVRCESLLYMASRAQLYSEKIAPAMAQGKCVICDRWLSSTYAYQAVAGKIGAEVVLQTAQASLERVWPDLTIIVDLPSDVGLDRVGAERDRMEQKPHDFHQRVRQAFLELAQRGEAPMAVVDAAGSPADVHERIIKEVTDRLT